MPRGKDTLLNLVGQRFGRLTVLSEACRDTKNRVRCWRCICDCGQEITRAQPLLRRGKVKSCGCLRGSAGGGVVTHGLTRTGNVHPAYPTYRTMKQRCHNPNDSRYKYYGARGIKVCERWRNSFASFLADMGPKPSPNHSIDRIDNDGPYSPDNCRWATHAEQCNNKRTNRRLTFNNETHTLTEWSKITGLSVMTLYNRVRHGWTVLDTLTRPVRLCKRRES